MYWRLFCGRFKGGTIVLERVSHRSEKKWRTVAEGFIETNVKKTTVGFDRRIKPMLYYSG